MVEEEYEDKLAADLEADDNEEPDWEESGVPK